MRLALVLAATLAVGAGAIGCKTTYVPVVRHRPVAAGVDTGPSRADPYRADAPLAATAAARQAPRERVEMVPVTTIDWGRIGDVCVGALEITGIALYYTALITAEALAKCGHSICHR